MAVAVMGSVDDEHGDNPVYHDFLGMSCGDTPPVVWAKVGGGRSAEAAEASVSVSAASAGASSGGHDVASGSEKNYQLLGRKRRKFDSAFVGFLKEKGLSMASDSPESSRILKEVTGKMPGRSHGDVTFTTQPPQQPTSVMLHPPVAGKPDPVALRSECSTPSNSGLMVHHASRFGPSTVHVDKLSSCTYKDSGTVTPFLSHAAADEGSRTGITSARILNIVCSGERKSTGILPCGNRAIICPQMTELESSRTVSHHGIPTASRQMTIFYAGHAHVFDDVHPNKADMIMALAGSDGGSWSTCYAARPIARPPGTEVISLGREQRLPAAPHLRRTAVADYTPREPPVKGAWSRLEESQF